MSLLRGMQVQTQFEKNSVAFVKERKKIKKFLSHSHKFWGEGWCIESLKKRCAAETNTSVERSRAVDVPGHKRGLGLFSDRVVPHSTDAALRRKITFHLIKIFTLGKKNRSLHMEGEWKVSGFQHISSSVHSYSSQLNNGWDMKKKRCYRLSNLVFNPETCQL